MNDKIYLVIENRPEKLDMRNRNLGTYSTMEKAEKALLHYMLDDDPEATIIKTIKNGITRYCYDDSSGDMYIMELNKGVLEWRDDLKPIIE